MPQYLVKTLTGRSKFVDLDEELLIIDFKKVIEDYSGCPVDAQLLIYRGQILEDDIPIMKYKIEYGSAVHLVMRFKGG